MANSTISTINLPPVPQAVYFNDQGVKIQVGATWNQWFIQLQQKVNLLNSRLGALSGSTYAGTNGTYGSSTEIPVVTVVGGVVTNVTQTPIGNASPLTTKGDIYTFSTVNARLPVGTAGYVLTASPSTTTGLAWAPATTPTLPITTKGDILGYDTAPNRIPVGSDGYILTADSTNPLGVSWKSPGGTASYSPVVLADNPLGFWELAEASGTTAMDSSPNGNNGTYSGGVTFLGANAPGNLPGGVLLNTGLITIPANVSLNVSTAWTIEAWVIVENYGTGNFPSCMIEQYTGGSNPVGYALGINPTQSGASGGIATAFYTGSSWQATQGPVASFGILLHIVGQYDGSALYQYVNGILLSKSSTSSQVPSNNGLFLGSDHTGASNFLHGVLACCALYGTVLTPARIKAHYLAGR